VGGWGTINGRNMLRDDEVTMANIFHHNGYITGLFGKWHLGTSYPYRPIDRGFDEWLGHGDGGTGCTTDYWGNDRVNDHYIHNGQWEGKPRKGYECDVFFDAATQFIRKNKNRPFFTYLALYNPHGPCSIPDPEWAKSYQGENVPGDFYASIVQMDRNLGRLRQFLMKEELTENTLLIFLSDNGSAEGDKVFNAGMRGKKGSPYDGGHRVPCFLYWPAGELAMPRTITPLTAHLDWLPTLVDLCGLKLPRPVTFDGISLKPMLEKTDFSWPSRTIVLGTPKNNTGANPPSPGFGQNCAVMTDRWRLVNDQELYDMTNDPGQMQNVAGEHPGVVSQLHAFYQKYWEDVSTLDKGWRGRPIIGSPKAPEVALCAEDWFTTQGSCPWNQGAVALGSASFGKWPVRFAEAGTYRIELRRWPLELDTPMDGTPDFTKTVDAWLHGKPVITTLYNSTSQALPVTKALLQIGENVQEMKVEHGDKAAVFTMKVGAGITDISTTLFDKSGKSLCSAFYVEIRKL
jgi:arylsulfatase A-like enzyme